MVREGAVGAPGLGSWMLRAAVLALSAALPASVAAQQGGARSEPSHPEVPEGPALSGAAEVGEHAGPHGSRTYRLYVPSRVAAARGSDPAGRGPALVVLLHGCTQTAADFARGTRMDLRAEEHGFLVLYPEQAPDAHPQRCWRWYDPAHQRAAGGEPALLVALVREVVEAYEADPARIYVAGLSAGGAMALVLAATHPELFEAVAVHSGVAYGVAGSVAEATRVLERGPPTGMDLAAPLRATLAGRSAPRLLVVHGTADTVVRPVNGRRAAEQWLAVRDGEGGVELRMAEGVGHAWAGGDPAGSWTTAEGPDATAEILRFFGLDGTR